MSIVEPFSKERVKIALLENIHQVAVQKLRSAGYSVTEIPQALSETELLELIPRFDLIGIRSRTKVTEKHLNFSKNLLAIGCFGIGTSQVALTAATSAGIPVFNAPYSSTRSVAELSVGLVVALARKVGSFNSRMHTGRWEKSAQGCYEIRHKTLGIIGYGHIGQQVGVMAEALGLRVLFYDSTKKLPLGNAKPYEDLNHLLRDADFVTIHTPATVSGQPLIGANEFANLKKGAYLINLARGSAIDLQALKLALLEQRISGAALDVHPNEPKSNSAEFYSELAGMENVILTPHIGGSTEEAQENIGLEVAVSISKFIDRGTTSGAVNFPQIDLLEFPNAHRLLNVHKNVPGVLNDVNRLIANLGANIDAQYLSTYKDVGYLIVDINKDVSAQVKIGMESMPSNIRTRILY